MKIGVSINTLNTADWDRVTSGDWDAPQVIPDAVAVDRTMELGDLVEPLGFDSMWASEHFGTPYGLVPNSMQWLGYWAGRTERISFGTIVIVLPWWNPVRLAHEIAMLNLLSKGRHFTVGVGRGLNPDEFLELGVPQGEARQRFKETLEILKLALSRPRFSYDGEIYKIPEMSLRPAPRTADIMDDVICAFNTPASMQMAAEQGIGQLFVTGQPLDKISAGVAQFNATRAGRGLEADQPTVYLWAYVSEDAEEAREKGTKYFARYQQEAQTHYGLDKPERFDGIPGYEGYVEMAKQMGGHHGGEQFAAMLEAQLIGTPDQVVENARRVQEATSCKEVVVIFSYGGMPHEESVRSMKLFGEKVLPRLQAMETPLHDSALPAAVSAGA
jgi:alkanesulfonate monooxygenase SsuD/methylene tetrahydromethanopterin reductase-like flavin-dependent oxidoreductase (luciferase family)